MANFRAVHSVGASLTTFLRNSYPEAIRQEFPCEFRLLSGGEVTRSAEIGTAVSLLLYRVTINEHLRNARRTGEDGRVDQPLAVDLHYLLTALADSAMAEQVMLAWTMLQLHQHPVLDLSSLSPEAGWTREDVVQLMPSELSNEDIMRIWDALEPSYRLSVSYTARVIRIDGIPEPDRRPVVATRISLREPEQRV